MSRRIHTFGVVTLVAGAVLSSPDAASRNVLSKPQPQVVLEPGLGTVHFDPTTGTFLVDMTTPAGRSKFTYEPRTNVDVVVEAAVLYDRETSVFSYEYTLQNMRTSKQAVSKFSVECDVESVDVHVPAGWWRVPSFGRPIVTWADKDNTPRGFAPGARLSGCSLRLARSKKIKASSPSGSKNEDAKALGGSLPGVVRCTAAGEAPVPSIPHLESMDEEDLRLPTPGEDVVSGRTVGPVSMPAISTPLERVQQIKKYVGIGVEEGWISDGEVAGQYADILSGMEAALSETSARGIVKDISKLAGRAENDFKDGKITSEAYALVKYNLQNLMPGK